MWELFAEEALLLGRALWMEVWAACASVDCLEALSTVLRALGAREALSGGLRTVGVGDCAAAARLKGGVPGVDGNGPRLYWTAVFRISWRVEDRSGARMFEVIDRAIVEWSYRVDMGRNRLSARIDRHEQG